MSTSIKGIDVSKWQGTINWAEVAGDGVKFAMIRLGYGGKNGAACGVDSFYQKNVEGALANGIAVGIVESVNGSTMKVIEGNMSDAVGRRTMQVNGRYIRGYGLPKFKGSVASSGNTTSKPAGGTSKKTVAQLADEVLAGKWGNGPDRKSRLTAAGYDYDAVQSAVNAKLSGQKAKKSNTEIAKEVIAGKWGNGADRRKRLEAAGYNYAAVQQIVNKLI